MVLGEDAMSASKFFFQMYALLGIARANGSRSSWKALWRFIEKRRRCVGIPELPGELEARLEASVRLWGHRW